MGGAGEKEKRGGGKAKTDGNGNGLKDTCTSLSSPPSSYNIHGLLVVALTHVFPVSNLIQKVNSRTRNRTEFV